MLSVKRANFSSMSSDRLGQSCSRTLQVSSLLGHYARLYGPQILLLMNIFYYLPSIPLLLLSAMCDGALDRAFGECLHDSCQAPVKSACHGREPAVPEHASAQCARLSACQLDRALCYVQACLGSS